MIELLEHNVETYNQLCAEMEKHTKVALVQATGTGKSYIIGKYIEEHNLDALILVPSNAIGEQWRKLLPDAEISTYQAMARGIAKKYDLIVADEMHHLGSDVWGNKFIEYFMNDDFVKVIGATATEIRYLDKSRDMVEEIFNGIAVRGIDLATAINDGILPTFRYVVSVYGTENEYEAYRDKIKKIKDDKVAKNLSNRLELCIQNQIGIKEAMYENLNMADHRIIVFLNGICEIQTAIEMFSDIFLGCDYNYVAHSRSNKENNESIIQFQKSPSKISILFAIDMLNEGVHIDGVDTVVMFRNTVSPQIYFQQLGRVLAVKKNFNPTVFDFVCNYTNITSKCNMETMLTIERINRKISDKKKKIIVKTYIKDLQDILAHIKSRVMPMPLTEDEKDYIREHIEVSTRTEISKAIGKSIDVITNFCRKERLKYIEAKNISISEKTKNFILNNYSKMTIAEMAKILDVHYSTVKKFLERNELKGQKCDLVYYDKEWVENNADKTYQEAAEILGVTQRNLKEFCNRNNIHLRNSTYHAVNKVDMSNGTILASYDSIADATRDIGKPSGGANISACIKGKQKSAFGYKWESTQQGEQYDKTIWN